jgi:hypothetical protein
MADLRGGSTAGGSQIVTKKDVPVLFRVNAGTLEYSENNGTTWVKMSNSDDATATAAQILSGYTAYIDGSKVTGTIPIAPTYPSCNTAVGFDAYANLPNGSHNLFMAVPAGYYAQGYWVGLNHPNLAPANIVKGVTIGNNVKITGTAPRYATGTSSTTLVAATLGWQPRVVEIKEVATGGVYGGFWLAFGPTFEYHYQRVVSGDGVYVPYTYDYPANTINFVYMQYTGAAGVYNNIPVINATGFSLETASYGNSGNSFVWYAWE